MEQDALFSAIESILFTSDKPVTLTRIKQVLGDETISEEELTNVMVDLKDRYQGNSHGFEIREAQGGFHFSTKATNAEWVRRFLETKPFRLGRSALETLAIVAYRQPVTRAEIDKVRGIDSSHLMRTLIERGLVKMAGKAEIPGRPVQYMTTPRFLEVVGLSEIAQLPPLSELDQLQGHTEDSRKPLEDGLEHFINEKSEVMDAFPDEAGLEAIDTMIQSVKKPSEEVFESELHAEIAAENQAALEGFLQFVKPLRRRRGDSVATEAAASAEDVGETMEAVSATETAIETIVEGSPSNEGTEEPNVEGGTAVVAEESAQPEEPPTKTNPG
jgi:segregation and condensation protein B